ncbi:MAG: GLPGLI family protein [Chitinophagaceae bacterium]|nr:GLPGLI family protein [Chitinophagaceae bacterium]
MKLNKTYYEEDLTAGLSLLIAMASLAQQKEGKVTYERNTQMSININNGAEPIQHIRKDKFELNFANNQMVWQQLPEDIQEEPVSNGGMVFRTVGGGGDDIVFIDFEKSRKVEGREFGDKKFIVTDSIRRNNWRLSEETKTILGYQCRKATTERIAKRTTMMMENGKMERREVDDTSEVVAWFTLSIPVPAGPDFQGQLPGLILEMEMNDGKMVYRAVEVKEKPNKNAIKEPTKGKKLLPRNLVQSASK